MKKFIKKITLFIVIVLSFLFTYPSNIQALTRQTSYVNINNTQNFEVEDLSFSRITFNDYSSSSTLSFGITGLVENTSNNDINYTSTIYYYDSNYNLIAQGYNTVTAKVGFNNFNQMSNLNILGGHSVNEIHYYRLLIETTDNQNSSVTNVESLTPSKNHQFSSYDYVIDKYDVNIVVNENNTFDITETITAYFNISKHGIFKTIPLKNKVTRLDGTTSTNRAQITNVSVNGDYTTSKENGNYKLKIGSANTLLTGEQTYIIKYTYNLGKDPVKDYDELYYNIIGKEWDTVIGNITFSITMPKEFDSSKLGFSSGLIGSTDNSKIKYNVSENKITGNYNDILMPNEALTVRCELSEGYFVGAGLNINIMNYIIYMIPILFLIIAILIWFKFGRDDQVIETIEFYPPKGLNSLEVGFLFKGKAENKDITSLLIFLANKGYLEISDSKIDLNSNKINLSEESKSNANKKIIELQNKIIQEQQINPNSPKIKYYKNMLDIYKNIDTPIDYQQYGLKSSINKSNKKNNFIIRKLKDYDGTNTNEKWFMEGLFEDDKTEVTDKMLYNNFYITNNKILHNINNKENIDQIFEKSASNKKFIINLMIIIAYCLITIPPVFNYGQSEEIIFALLFPSIGFSILLKSMLKKGNVIEKIFGLIWGLIFGGIPWLFIVLPTIIQDSTYLIGYIVGLICIIGMIVCLVYLPKRTKYGNEMLGKLKGFKNFLETVEKDKLEALVMENPNYFYDILPYTYVLGVSDKWIKKFESISLQAPNWYDSTNEFDIYCFGIFVDSAMTSAQKSMTSVPTSGSGGSSYGGSSGGSSGGGFSSGGSGGGGGGSW